ncbi:MAG: M10 family metallopeptidase C-terminal domain-containing protein [Leptolyngbyaceae cyanobacterium MO_188.B28]|nr:M10 family metallopeptidase C-terminal domain-containing protein [Leptolyngbyaceae cyanobacterium MO_188.B28]
MAVISDSDLFKGSDLDIELKDRLTSNLEFSTPLKKRNQSTLIKTEGEEEELSSPQDSLTLGKNPAGDDSPLETTFNKFRADLSAIAQSPDNAETQTSIQQRSVGVEVSVNGDSGLLSQRSGWVGDGPGNSQDTPNFGCNCSACCSAGVSDFTHLVSGADLSDDPNDVKLNVPKSGDIRIDPLIHGHKWTTPTITYSFFDDQKGKPYYSSSYDGIAEISDKMKSYLRDILENVLEPLINVDFVEVEDTKNSYGQIRYMYTTSTSSASTTRLSSSSDRAGDVRFNPKITKDIEAGPGAYRYETLVHETLHALGMKHPGNYNGSSNGGQDGPFLLNGDDHSGNSILSYNRLKELNQGAITPMTYDIRALQYLYGAKEHEVGDTIYKFDTVNGYSIGNNFFGSKDQKLKQTIWDTQGNDTYNFAGLAFKNSGYHFDLREDGWITTKDAFNSTTYTARGNGKKYKTTAFGTKTAFNMTIEDVVASSSSDDIYLNKAANTISGYQKGSQAGNDVLYYTDGKDVLDLSSYKSSDVTQTNSGDDLVLDLGGDGKITIKNYVNATKDNQIKILFDGTPTGPVDPPVTSNLIEGTSGDDTVNGTQGKDLIKGHDGVDVLVGRNGNDELLGGRGGDTLRGGRGNDTLKGSYGADILIGGHGYDTLIGGKGDDSFVFNSIDDRRDVITDFGKGSDTINLQAIFAGNEYASLDAFKDYVKLVQSGANTKVQVDALGDNGDQFRTLAILNNVTATDLTAAQFRV